MSSSKRLPGSKDKLKKAITSAASTSSTTSGVATLSKSTSMRSASFVSPINSNKLSLVDEETGEDDDTANGSKPSNVFCKQHKWTATSTGDQTTVNLVVTEMVFPKIKFVDRDTQLMFSHEKKKFANMSFGVAIYTRIFHYQTGGNMFTSLSLKLQTVCAMIATPP
jgi:hypothetical protein